MMKKFWIVLSLILVLTLSGFKSVDESSTMSASNNVSAVDAIVTVEADTSEITEDICLPLRSISKVITDISKDIWYVKTYENFIPFTPDDYNGSLINYTARQIRIIGAGGVLSEVTYKDVAFISDNETPYEGKYSDYLQPATYLQSNGESVNGMIFCTPEQFQFLEHYHYGTLDRFFIDINLPSDIIAHLYSPADPFLPKKQTGIYILAQNENKVLMRGGSYIFTYDFQTAKTNLISDSVLDYKSPVEGECYFTDWDHIERSLDWEHDDAIAETGNKVISYHNDNFDLFIQEDFEKEFLTIQAALRNGETATEIYANKYSIGNGGDMYRHSNGDKFANIHLPHAYEYNNNLMSSESGSCWLIEDCKLTLYRFGEEVTCQSLPDGTWKIINSDMSLAHHYEDGSYISEVDTNNDGKSSPEEIHAAITSSHIILMNVDESAVYVSDHLDEPFKKVFTDVVDYHENFTYDDFCWMDSSGNAYRYDWLETQTNKLMGENAIGFPPRFGDYTTFVVKPDDPRIIRFIEGFPLYWGWLDS